MIIISWEDLGRKGPGVLMLEAIQDLYLFNHRPIILIKSPLSSLWKKTFSRKVIFNLLREGEFVEEEAPWAWDVFLVEIIVSFLP